MAKWGDSEDDVDVFGDVITEPVPVVGGRTPPEESLARDKGIKESVKRIFSTVQLSVPHHKLIIGVEEDKVTGKPGKQKEFVVYIIQCTGAERSWQVQKRFSEVHAMHTKLLTLNKGRHDKVPSFPSRVKKPLETAQEQIRRRTARLDNYFSNVWNLVLDGTLKGEEILIHFLQTDTHGQANFTTISDALAEEEKTERLLKAAQSWRRGADGGASPRETDLLDGQGGVIRLPEVPWTPAATVVSSGSEHLIVLEVPGLADADLTTTALEDGMRVYGHRSIDVPNANVVHNDRSFGSFAIDFLIPEKYAPFTTFERSLEHGLLRIVYSTKHSAASTGSASLSGLSGSTNLKSPSSRRQSSRGGCYSPRAVRAEGSSG